MDYPLMAPPFEFKSFNQMTKKEAQIYFDWYLSEFPSRLALLRQAYVETTGNNSEDLDLTPESLTALWDWFLPRIEMVSKSEQEIVKELEEIPNWLKDEIRRNTRRLSIGTIQLTVDISIYLGEALKLNFEELDWGIVTKSKSYIYVNRPLIICPNLKIDISPENIVHILTLQAVEGNTDKEALYNIYLANTEDLPSNNK